MSTRGEGAALQELAQLEWYAALARWLASPCPLYHLTSLLRRRVAASLSNGGSGPTGVWCFALNTWQ